MVNFFFFWTREAVTRQTGENELDTKKNKKNDLYSRRFNKCVSAVAPTL